MQDIIKQVIYSVCPISLYERTQKPLRKNLLFFSKSLFVAFIIMGFFYIPTLARLPAYFDQQMSKFKSLSIDSNFSVMSPVYFPERDGLLIIDTTGLHKKLKYERFLITREGVHFKLFHEPVFIKAENFGDVLSHKESFSLLFTTLLVLFLPALVFWSYFFLWFKYVVQIILLSSVFFTLFDLTHWRKSWKQFFNIAAFTSLFPILLEVISLPFGTDFLVPIVETIGGDLYAVPLIVHSVFIIAFSFVVHKAGKHAGE